MTKDIHQPLCFQQFSMATPQKHYLKRGEKPPQNPIMKFFLFQAHPRESKKHQLPQWLMSSGGGARDHPLPLPFIRENNARTHGSPLVATERSGSGKLSCSLSGNLICKAFGLGVNSRGVQESESPVITVTNPGTLAAVDPFGSWGELAGGGVVNMATFPSPVPPVWRETCIYTGPGVRG